MALLLDSADWTPDQWRTVREVLHQHYLNMVEAGNPITRHVTSQDGYEAVRTGEVQAVITEGYLVIYDVGGFWYAASVPLLFEVMVLRLPGTAGKYTSVTAALSLLAVQHGCTSVVAGNATGRRGLTRMYERQGYVPLAEQFIKEIK